MPSDTRPLFPTSHLGDPGPVAPNFAVHTDMRNGVTALWILVKLAVLGWFLAFGDLSHAEVIYTRF